MTTAANMSGEKHAGRRTPAKRIAYRAAIVPAEAVADKTAPAFRRALITEVSGISARRRRPPQQVTAPPIAGTNQGVAPTPSATEPAATRPNIMSAAEHHAVVRQCFKELPLPRQPAWQSGPGTSPMHGSTPGNVHMSHAMSETSACARATPATYPTAPRTVSSGSPRIATMTPADPISATKLPAKAPNAANSGSSILPRLA
jgi:hypothetical protein